MYDTWDVGFDTTGKNRSPCDRLYRPNVLTSGGVGCPDVFSNAFSAALNIEIELTIDMNPDFLDFPSPSTAVSDTMSSRFLSHSTPPTGAQGDQLWQCQAQWQPPQTDVASLGPKQRSFVSTPDIWVFHDPAASPSVVAELSRIMSEERNAHLRVGPLEPVPESIPMASAAQNIPALTITEHSQVPPTSFSQVPQTSSLMAPPYPSPPSRPKRRNTLNHLAANRAAAKRSRKQRKASRQRLENECVSLRECIDVKAEEVSGLAMEVTLLKQEVWKCAHCHQRYLAALQGAR